METGFPLAPNQPREQQEEGTKPFLLLFVRVEACQPMIIWKALFWSEVALACEGWGCDFKLFLSTSVPGDSFNIKDGS